MYSSNEDYLAYQKYVLQHEPNMPILTFNEFLRNREKEQIERIKKSEKTRNAYSS